MSSLLSLLANRAKLAAPASHGVYNRALGAIGATMLVCFAGTADAAQDPSARLVRCGEESCLLVTGQRDDPATLVKINGRSVAVDGGKSWEHRMPLPVLRQWTEPHARTIDVSLHSQAVPSDHVAEVELPIGLLGNTTMLEAIQVSVH